ncbi:aldehyde-alcohol dehydrogenase [Alphaproteobacteria bacterium]|nr:aldehyde-alcohol dehydrogenase [Alphaproteobacteria bacterium]
MFKKKADSPAATGAFCGRPVSKTPVPDGNPEELAELDAMVARVRAAQLAYATFNQEQVDKVFRAAAMAASASKIALAKLAVEESGMGVMEDKVIKNQFASEYIYNTYRATKTCGVVEDDRAGGFRKIAEPMGLVAAIVPTTNPTSTTIFKALLCLKTRNGIIVSPHPRAKKATAETVRIMLEAAVEAGAPADILACIANPSNALTQALMKHDDINLILATGGMNMVKAAYSSGRPAIGVGAGNTPVIIDKTADIKTAVNSIILSKTFDHGVICASEQALIITEPAYAKARAEFEARDCFFVEGKDKAKLAAFIMKDGAVNSAIVGQPATKIAEMAGVKACPDAKILIAEVKEVGDGEPFSHEKLSPVLALYKVKNFKAAVEVARKIVAFGGNGHTSVLYTDETHAEHIRIFQENMRTGRVLINMPASLGAIGDIYNFKLPPSLTLGCGSWGGNSVSENIGVKHLMNFKSVAERRENMLWYRVPEKIYFKPGSLGQALEELHAKRRTLIITDKTMEQLGYVDKVATILEGFGQHVRIFSDVQPDPTIGGIAGAVETAASFKPDMIVALGGGSPIDAAKMIWLLYEHPGVRFADIALRFMDIRKRIEAFPKMGQKATFVAVPTTSGTGSEITPFTVITDEKTGIKYPIADYELTPNVAIVDPDLVMDMPASLAAYSGMDAMTHCIEAYTSVYANNFSDGQALESLRLIFKYLAASVKEGKANPKAREKMHYASTLAGMAFANAFLGVCHSMAHTIGGAFHVPHGLANAIILPYAIGYNATDNPSKQGIMPQYKYPFVKGRYAKIADFLGLTLPDASRDKKVDALIDSVLAMRAGLAIPAGLKDAGVPEQPFLARLDELAEKAFDDQCTGGNPRYPLIPEIKQLYLDAYYGKPAKRWKK